jgi:hypothetical protein
MNGITEITRQFSMNTRLFRNVLEGISEKESLERMSEHTNHLRWIAGHLTGNRYRNLVRMGFQPVPFEYLEIYFIPDAPPPGNRPCDPALAYPELKELLYLWDAYADPFIRTVSALTPEQLAAPVFFQTPIGGGAMRDFYTFLASHEMYHIGQMSVIRRMLGHDAMAFIK